MRISVTKEYSFELLCQSELSQMTRYIWVGRVFTQWDNAPLDLKLRVFGQWNKSQLIQSTLFGQGMEKKWWSISHPQ